MEMLMTIDESSLILMVMISDGESPVCFQDLDLTTSFSGNTLVIGTLVPPDWKGWRTVVIVTENDRRKLHVYPREGCLMSSICRRPNGLIIIIRRIGTAKNIPWPLPLRLIEFRMENYRQGWRRR